MSFRPGATQNAERSSKTFKTMPQNSGVPLLYSKWPTGECCSMSLKIWYKYLLEVKVTHTESEDTSVLVPCRVERLAPAIDWGRSWRAVCVPGLSPVMHSFLWRRLHDILPTQERLHRMNMSNTPSPLCVSCSEGEIDSLNMLC